MRVAGGDGIAGRTRAGMRWGVAAAALCIGSCERTTGPGQAAFAVVSTGGIHTCAVTGGGAAYCWGNNVNGELGDTGASSSLPVRVPGRLVFAQVTSGLGHTCGRVAGGAVYCWGADAFGERGSTSTAYGGGPLLVAGSRLFATVSAGQLYSCGVTAAGAGYCWGDNANGELGTGSTTGAALCSGSPCSLTPVPVAGGLGFTDISAGYGHSCGVATAGAAYCWGSNLDGGLGSGDTTTSSTPVPVAGGLVFGSVSAGQYYSCGVTTAGAAYCWGYNGLGQLGNDSTTNSLVPVAVHGGLTFAEISVGYRHVCGVATGGTAYCWGDNAYGELGDGEIGGGSPTANRSRPSPVTGGLTFRSISAGNGTTCGVTTDDAAYCWGKGTNGQLGYGAANSTATPYLVPHP